MFLLSRFSLRSSRGRKVFKPFSIASSSELISIFNSILYRSMISAKILWSSGQQPVSSHSCWMYVRAGRPAFARPCVGIHKSTSLMSSSLLLQQCPACLVRLTIYIYIYIYIYISEKCVNDWINTDLQI